MQYLITSVLIVVLMFALPAMGAIKTGRARFVLPVAGIVTGGALAWFWSWAWANTAHEEVLDSIVSVDGDTLVVSYVGGECEDHRSVSVEQSRQRVAIAVTSRSFASGCSDIGVVHRITIRLTEPLGDREVRNLGCTPDVVACDEVLDPLT